MAASGILNGSHAGETRVSAVKAEDKESVTSVASVMLVEDDLLLGKSVHRGLVENGFDSLWVRTGRDALCSVLEERREHDVVVLDLMLPDVSGWDVLAALRKQKSSLPVLVLTALGSVEEKVRGLNAGADDYLVKPFAFAELVARLHALLRRAELQAKDVLTLEVGPLRLNLVTRVVQREGRQIELTETEFKLLEYLMRNANHVVTRRMLCEYLWEADWEGVTNIIEVHINRLRSKVDRGFRQPLIETVRGVGYVLRSR
ncbi:MAG: DNA-binding response regulator [Pirellulaceae bacterium]|nr:MAG: DNA-binding response regulator [Pirellulaceae bacterium]